MRSIRTQTCAGECVVFDAGNSLETGRLEAKIEPPRAGKCRKHFGRGVSQSHDAGCALASFSGPSHRSVLKFPIREIRTALQIEDKLGTIVWVGYFATPFARDQIVAYMKVYW